MGWIVAFVLFWMWRHQRGQRWNLHAELEMRAIARDEIGGLATVTNLREVTGRASK